MLRPQIIHEMVELYSPSSGGTTAAAVITKLFVLSVTHLIFDVMFGLSSSVLEGMVVIDVGHQPGWYPRQPKCTDHLMVATSRPFHPFAREFPYYSMNMAHNMNR
jgi:hypothetical protein